MGKWGFEEPPKKVHCKLESLAVALVTANRLVFDFETTGVQPRTAAICGLGIYIPDQHKTFYINVGHALTHPDVPKHDSAALADALRCFFTDPTNHAIAHNASYDLRLLMKMGIDPQCRVSCTLVHTHRCNENYRETGDDPTHHPSVRRLGYGLKILMAVLFGKKPPSLVETTHGRNALGADPWEVAKYCMLDCINTWNLYRRAEEITSQDAAVRELINLTDDPNNMILAKMMWEGIGVDAAEAQTQYDRYQKSIQACKELIWQLTNVRRRLDTPREILEVLSTYAASLRTADVEPDQNNDAPDPRSDDIGFYSVRGEALEEAFESCPSTEGRQVIASVLSLQAMKQRCSSFLLPMSSRSGKHDGRVYLDRFSSTLKTTRFSCSPNLQNLPGRADKTGTQGWREVLPLECAESASTRNIFVAKPSFKLVEMDLSAAEPRYMALLFERALKLKDKDYRTRKTELKERRIERWGDLMLLKADLADPPKKTPQGIQWPTYEHDPLWEVFRDRGDPYDALLKAMDETGHANAVAAGIEAEWLKDNRAVGKRAFLALAYGSQAGTLAPQLGWSLERTEEALVSLKARYATMEPLFELTKKEMIHLGHVRSLWGRPRRINGYFELAGIEPVKVCFSYRRPSPRTYIATIVPLGSTMMGVQAFIKDCRYEDEAEPFYEADWDGRITRGPDFDAFFRKPHFNKPPFRNINFGQIHWVETEDGFVHHLPRLERGARQAFNALCQATGADHLRWLMSSMDEEVCRQAEYLDCRLVLSVHDSLIYEVPEGKVQRFVEDAHQVMSRRPPWSDIDFAIKCEVGFRFGEMEPITPNQP